jgi:hypothetical protein
MATDPIVHDVDDEGAQPPRKPDPRIGPNVSPKHRAILEAALAQPIKRSLFDVLASMPNVGEDSDFDRHWEPPCS